MAYNRFTLKEVQNKFGIEIKIIEGNVIDTSQKKNFFKPNIKRDIKL